jgi:hypothetical protein
MATLLRDYTRLQDLSRNQGATWTELPPGACPLHPNAPVLEGRLVDDQVNVPGGVPSERSDLQGASVFVPGSDYSIVWADNIVQLPVNTGDPDRWFYLGPEIHGRNLEQAPWAMGVRPDGLRRQEVNPDSGAARYTGAVTPDVGVWHQWLAQISYRAGGAAYARVWRDGVVVADHQGPVVQETGVGWFKLAMYRNRGRSGTVVYRVCRTLIYSGIVQPTEVFPGATAPTPPPVPPAPRVTLHTPVSGATVTSPIRVTATVTNPPQGGVMYVGVAAGESRQLPAATAVDVSLPAQDGRQWIYVGVHNAAGGKVAEAAAPVNVETTTPPPPAPVVDVAAVRAELAAARAAVNRAEDLLP